LFKFNSDSWQLGQADLQVLVFVEHTIVTGAPAETGKEITVVAAVATVSCLR